MFRHFGAPSKGVVHVLGQGFFGRGGEGVEATILDLEAKKACDEKVWRATRNRMDEHETSIAKQTGRDQIHMIVNEDRYYPSKGQNRFNGKINLEKTTTQFSA